MARGRFPGPDMNPERSFENEGAPRLRTPSLFFVLPRSRRDVSVVGKDGWKLGAA